MAEPIKIIQLMIRLNKRPPPSFRTLVHNCSSLFLNLFCTMFVLCFLFVFYKFLCFLGSRFLSLCRPDSRFVAPSGRTCEKPLGFEPIILSQRFRASANPLMFLLYLILTKLVKRFDIIFQIFLSFCFLPTH